MIEVKRYRKPDGYPTRYWAVYVDGQLLAVMLYRKRAQAVADMLTVVNEFDRCSRDAQDLLLTMLDRMPAGHAFLATTNLDIGNLTERLQTRFLPVRLQPPENEAIAAFLARRWAVPIATTRMIAAGAGGNVRAAMADLEMWMG